jgi:hypothetical protein
VAELVTAWRPSVSVALSADMSSKRITMLSMSPSIYVIVQKFVFVGADGACTRKNLGMHGL